MSVAEVVPALGLMREWGAERGINLDEAACTRFRVYLERLLLWNRRTRLVSQSSPLAIVTKHFMDSLTLVPGCRGGPVIDLGSGAGFPGLVLAAAAPGVDVWLVDSNRKRVSFLTEVVAAARIDNAVPVESRIERLADDTGYRGRYAVAVARALCGIADFLRLARPFLCPGGRAVAMKGPGHRRECEGLDPCALGFHRPDVFEYELADGTRRALLTFQVAAPALGKPESTEREVLRR